MIMEEVGIEEVGTNSPTHLGLGCYSREVIHSIKQVGVWKLKKKGVSLRIEIMISNLWLRNGSFVHMRFC